MSHPAITNKEDMQVARELARAYSRLSSNDAEVRERADAQVASSHRSLLSLRQHQPRRAEAILGTALYLYKASML